MVLLLSLGFNKFGASVSDRVSKADSSHHRGETDFFSSFVVHLNAG